MKELADVKQQLADKSMALSVLEDTAQQQVVFYKAQMDITATQHKAEAASAKQFHETELRLLGAQLQECRQCTARCVSMLKPLFDGMRSFKLQLRGLDAQTLEDASVRVKAAPPKASANGLPSPPSGKEVASTAVVDGGAGDDANAAAADVHAAAEVAGTAPVAGGDAPDAPLQGLPPNSAPLEAQLVQVSEALQFELQMMTREASVRVAQTAPTGGDWQAKLLEVRKLVAKLVHAEASFTSNYTCMACLQPYKDPISCVPCGHSYCRTCFRMKDNRCQECQVPGVPGGTRVAQTLPNIALDYLVTKLDFKADVLLQLKQFVNRHVMELYSTQSAEALLIK